MRTGYEKHTLSIAAIWYGLTTSCIRISNLNNKGHVQLCHLSIFLFATAMYCKKKKEKKKLKSTHVIVIFLQALTPPQVMIYTYE